ncbi:MAG: antibiotic biosynthesis monooxygenase [Hyphomicrobiales bacterium]|nr:antibiotic biosynthesis monooxygenase [Hyphomicrobiales bacterium]
MATNSGVVTQITTVKLPPDNQDEVLALMTERAQFMARQPGFVSICLYRSTDGSHVVNHVQWTDRARLEAAHRSPEFRRAWSTFGELAQEIEPCLYDVVHIETASTRQA